MCTQIARWHELHVSTTVMRYSHDFNLSRRQKRDASAAACSLLGWQFSDDAGACWCRLQTLGKMQASDELTDAQVRQLLFDLDSSYQAFNQLLHSTWTIEQQRTCALVLHLSAWITFDLNRDLMLTQQRWYCVHCSMLIDRFICCRISSVGCSCAEAVNY